MSKIKRVQINVLIKPNFPPNGHSLPELRLPKRLSIRGNELKAQWGILIQFHGSNIFNHACK